MTSLFSRLQKLNKEASNAPWKDDVEVSVDDDDGAPLVYTAKVLESGEGYAHVLFEGDWASQEDAALIVECRNSLPAVLNLIEAAEEMVSWDYVGDADQDVYKRLERAVAVFVSGQEEPK